MALCFSYFLFTFVLIILTWKTPLVTFPAASLSLAEHGEPPKRPPREAGLEQLYHIHGMECNYHAVVRRNEAATK